MDAKDVKPGVYVLTRDVGNPHPDRRATRTWNRFPVWAKGTRIMVQSWAGTETWEIWEEGDYRHNGVAGAWPEHKEQIAALIEGMEPAERTVFTLFAEHHIENSYSQVLQTLVDSGKLTLNDVEEAIKVWLAA